MLPFLYLENAHAACDADGHLDHFCAGVLFWTLQPNAVRSKITDEHTFQALREGFLNSQEGFLNSPSAVFSFLLCSSAHYIALFCCY